MGIGYEIWFTCDVTKTGHKSSEPKAVDPAQISDFSAPNWRGKITLHTMALNI